MRLTPFPAIVVSNHRFGVQSEGSGGIVESYNEVPIPVDGGAIQVRDHKLSVPDNPIIPFIEGDGVGPDIWRAARTVFDAAVLEAYGGRRRVAWYEVFAGEKAYQKFNDWLPQGTLDAIRQFHVAIKGPLTTPVGGGIRSLNVTLRLLLDLYVCLRPVRYFPGVPSPVKRPELLDVVIFRENTEDVYAGIEFREGTSEAHKVIDFLNREMGKKIRLDSGIGIKPMSVFGSKRLIRRAIQYAIENGRRSVTLVHKGNIMKYTEGAFRDWGYDVAKEEFGAVELDGGPWCVIPEGKPGAGIGIAPGGNSNYLTGHAIFEATHGTAPKYAGKDQVNPGSVVLSGEMMLRYLGWTEAADLIVKGLKGAIGSKRVTYDFARQMEGATEIKCSQFGDNIIAHM